MRTDRWIVARVFVLLCLWLQACTTLPANGGKEETHHLPPARDTPTAQYAHAEVAKHQGQSGFRLLTLSTNALLSRVVMADHAKHSIDLQYYIFANDMTGHLLMQHLLAAADRGVRVRMLIDDNNFDDKDHLFEALNAHPNIDVRLFNPLQTRNPSTLSRATQFMLEWRRLNRRMHNKSFIVDNTVAVIGGRNIGDPYFDAGSDTHFRDLDVVAIGPVVPQASEAFDAYWNCAAAYPLNQLAKDKASGQRLAAARQLLQHDVRSFAQSDYAQTALDQLPDGPTADRQGAWFWGDAELVADQPEKIEADGDVPALRIGPRLKTMLDGAQHSVIATTPYFIPGEQGTRHLVSRVQSGISIQILTNSLASTDEPAAHAGYVHYRKAMVEGGVQLYELKPSSGQDQPSTAMGKSSGISLHAKSIVVDGRQVFIGSLNMDQRSKLLNTEMGVIVDSPGLAKAITDFFHTATQPSNAYQVTLDPASHQLVWHAEDKNGPVTYQSEPEATAKRRTEVTFLRLLPIDSLL
ncbi:phospholipase D family protein [Dyella japonica]|uniref:Phospholipase n=1 Tax=Dyella japonica A8 TaxID=1217721 RepID=A0A075JX34_9GAMM|nr:phospholipase D family protein [Dyella japonica]AIF46085.1 phospholipase [Dyella japonica A8]